MRGDAGSPKDQKGEQRSRAGELRTRTRAGTGGPAGGGGCLGVSRRACRAAALGPRGELAASAHVHAGHLRHQLPQRRLNGSEGVVSLPAASNSTLPSPLSEFLGMADAVVQHIDLVFLLLQFLHQVKFL